MWKSESHLNWCHFLTVDRDCVIGRFWWRAHIRCRVDYSETRSESLRRDNSTGTPFSLLIPEELV